MKYHAKAFLQSALGFHAYLVVHSLFVALTMRFRPHEGEVRAFISRLAPDAIVLDIGANVGAMTLLFARQCPKGRVYAFEPIPENYRAASAVLRVCRIKNATIFPLGVGERRESLTMVMPNLGTRVRMEGTSHVVRNPGFDDTGTLYRVQAIALDDFAGIADETRIDAIKIDVEDHEQFVLHGARKIIERDRPLIYCELWGDANKAACFAMLEDLDYHAFVAVRGELVPFDARIHRTINFFFLALACEEAPLSRAT
jgi:FkbM family methyltransferase